MISALLWLSVPLAPLVALLLILVLRSAPAFVPLLLALSCAPALIAAWLAAPAFDPVVLWEGARWGGEQTLLRAWLGFTALLWAMAGVYAGFSQHNDMRLKRFCIFWLLALSGNLLLIIAQDAASFYVGFSMMSLSAYGLVVHNGTSSARRAGRLYLQLAVLGEVLLLAGIMMRVHAAEGSVLFTDWSNAPLDPVAAVLLLVGLGLKAGFWPLHVWLPVAHPAAPAPASAVLSGAMIKAGILGLWIFLPALATPADTMVPDGTLWQLRDWSDAAMTVGIISAFFGVAVGLTRYDAKQVLAYSSVSQMGYLLFIVALSWKLPEHKEALTIALVIYAVHHGFAKGALFLAADLFKSGRANTTLQLGILLLLLAIPSLALTGMVFTSGAIAKTSLKTVLESAELVQWVPWLQAGAVATTLLLARAVFLVMALQNKTDAAVPRPQLLIWSTLCLLPILLPWLWLWFWPDVREVLWQTLVPYKMIEASWPVLAGLLVAVLAIRMRLRAPRIPPLFQHPFLALSLLLKRRMNQALLPDFELRLPSESIRAAERRWNRYWQGRTINRSAALLLLFVIAAALVILSGSG